MTAAERNSIIKVGRGCHVVAMMAGCWRRLQGVARLLRSQLYHTTPMAIPCSLSCVQLVLNITAAFSSFQRWTVGLGIEHQLQQLQATVGLPPTQVREFVFVWARVG